MYPKFSAIQSLLSRPESQLRVLSDFDVLKSPNEVHDGRYCSLQRRIPPASARDLEVAGLIGGRTRLGHVFGEIWRMRLLYADVCVAESAAIHLLERHF